MEIICLRENLLKAINQTEKIIGKNFSLPILNNLYFKTEKGRLKITATNLEIAISSWVPGKINEEGETTIPAKIISGIISGLSDDKINLRFKDNLLIVKTDNYQAQINTINPKEFPLIPKIKSENKIKINQKILKKHLSRVIKVVSESTINSVLSGILVDNKKKEIKFVATDSFRLAVSIEKKENENEEISFIIPFRTALEIIRLSSDKDFDVEINIGENQAVFIFEQSEIISRLIEGKFPDYEKIIPNNFETKIFLDKNDFLKNIKLVGLFSARLGEIKINPLNDKENLEIKAEENNLGTNKSVISAQIQGKTEEVVFNYRYLLDGLDNLEENKIIFSLNGNSGPSYLNSLNKADYFYLLMPIRNQ
ncbi:MAG: DNA polymerase III subunit beta [Parcubacteria group bacterium]|nr:DNA polymerase III subunit beta [Parcubacteria group bacterium]